MFWQWEEFEDTKGVIRIGKSKKNRQQIDKKKKEKQRSTKHTHNIQVLRKGKQFLLYYLHWSYKRHINCDVIIIASNITCPRHAIALNKNYSLTYSYNYDVIVFVLMLFIVSFLFFLFVCVCVCSA